MSKLYIGSALSLLLACPAVYAADAAPVISSQAAQAAFAETKALCEAEAGALWGKSLCVPRIFVDEDSHQAVLSEPVEGAVKDGAFYRITLPKDMALANTSMELYGRRWSMVEWPLPEDATSRHILLMHEAYHSLQAGLGLTGSGGLGQNAHLDSRDGRVWLRAEFAALRAALDGSGAVRKQALEDALLFRAYRRSLWPQAAGEERGLELNEGLAESTGVDAALTEPAQRIAAARGDIDRIEKTASYVRSFAYATGPAYAELLDAAEPAWRKQVTTAFDFGAATARAYGLTAPKPDAKLAEQAFQHYGVQQVLPEEDARAQRIAKDNARYTAALVTGPTLTLPMKDFSISFDPRQVHTLPGQGSVYEKLDIGDKWGSLHVVSGMALVGQSFDKVTVPLSAPPSGQHLSGTGWTAELKDGVVLGPDPAKPGSFLLAPAAPGGAAH